MAVPAQKIPKCRFNIYSFDTIEYTAKDDGENDVDMVIKTMAISLEPYYNDSSMISVFKPWKNLRLRTNSNVPTIDKVMTRNTEENAGMYLYNNILYYITKTTKLNESQCGIINLLETFSSGAVILMIDVEDGKATFTFGVNIDTSTSEHTMYSANNMTFPFNLVN